MTKKRQYIQLQKVQNRKRVVNERERTQIIPEYNYGHQRRFAFAQAKYFNTKSFNEI